MAKKGNEGPEHRDTSGGIEKSHGDTRVSALRKTYDEQFAVGPRKDLMPTAWFAETGTDSSHTCLRRLHS